jgi:hypothetical protein
MRAPRLQRTHCQNNRVFSSVSLIKAWVVLSTFTVLSVLLSIAQDLTPPSIVSAFKTGNLITLEFSEPLRVNGTVGVTTFRDSQDFEYVAEPSEIFDGFDLINDWTNAGGASEFDLADDFVTMIAADKNGWIQHDNDQTPWELGVADGGSWTVEISVRIFPDEANGLVLWAANGKERNIVQINDTHTQLLDGLVIDEHDNTDDFHMFRMAYAAESGSYFIWRDQVLLTPPGLDAQASSGNNRLIVGDCCSGLLMTEIDIAHVRYDTTGAFSPTKKQPTDAANLLGNYVVQDGEVRSVQVKEDGQTVVVTVMGVDSHPTASMTIAGIADLAGNLMQETSLEVTTGGPKITELNSDDFELVAGPADIFDGNNLLNGWENAGGNTELILSGDHLKLVAGANNGWLQHDNDVSTWESGVADGLSWTAEMRIRLADDEGNGLTLWGANGSERNIIQINTHSTQILGGAVIDEHSNTDQWHTFRMAYEWQEGLYFVWRDGILITPQGVAAQAATSSNRFIVGDCCSGIGMTRVDLEYIRYDTTGAYSPPSITERDSVYFEYAAKAQDIFDGSHLKDNWTVAGGTIEVALDEGFLTLNGSGGNGWIQHDSDNTPWELGVSDGQSWTAEIRVRLSDDDGNGLTLWGANGSERNIIQINTGNTQLLGGDLLDEHDNTDAFHTFRMAYESRASEYFIWRDGILITPEGVPAQAATSSNRLIIGDCCSGINMSRVDLEYARYDTNGAFSPPALVQLDSETFSFTANAREIFDGVDLQDDWVNAGGVTEFELTGEILSFISTENNGWIEHNNEGTTPWEMGVADGGGWTAEMRVKLAPDEANAMVLWAANGSERHILQVNTDGTQWYGGPILHEGDNTDGFHTFRVAFESEQGLYYAWRDDVLLGEEGSKPQAATNQSRFIVGDCCSSIATTGFELEYIRYDTTHTFSPLAPVTPPSISPTVALSRDESGSLVIDFVGQLEQAVEVGGPWDGLSGPSPVRIPSEQLKGKAFFRAVSHE